MAAPKGASFFISGRGWGHGIGMSQWGAYGYAQRGTTYDQILSHYYTGTVLGNAPVSRVRVLLGEGKKAIAVSSDSPFSVKDGSGAVHQLQPGPYSFGPGLKVKVDAAQPAQALPGPLVFVPGATPLKYGGKEYRGQLQVNVVGKTLQLVNSVGLQQYLYGVVPREVPSAWPVEALKAQAVVARSYALAVRKSGAAFDLFADTRSQVYGGIAAEKPTTTAAVDATSGQVLLFEGKVATTYFFSTSGGRTASIEDAWARGEPTPYLVSVPDPYDTASPHHVWGPFGFTAAKLTSTFKVPGTLLDVKIAINPSQRVREMTLVGTEGRGRGHGGGRAYEARAPLDLVPSGCALDRATAGSRVRCEDEVEGRRPRECKGHARAARVGSDLGARGSCGPGGRRQLCDHGQAARVDPVPPCRLADPVQHDREARGRAAGSPPASDLSRFAARPRPPGAAGRPRRRAAARGHELAAGRDGRARRCRRVRGATRADTGHLPRARRTRPRLRRRRLARSSGRRGVTRLVVVAFVVALLQAAPAQAGRFAVGIEPGASLDDVAARVERTANARTDRSLGALGALVVETRSARALRKLQGVQYVERIDRPRRLAFAVTDPLAVKQWHLDQDHAFEFWPEFPALAGPKIAVIDSGIDGSHPEFAGRIAASRSFVGSSALNDQQGHGTFVAGLIAAQTNNAQGIAGMALGSQLLIAKVVRANRQVLLEAEAQAIRWAVDNGARVINLSLGGLRDPRDPSRDTYSALEAAAVRYAYTRGVVVVAAVGNGDQAPTSPWRYASYPAALPHVIGVSALAKDGSVPMFSNRDPIYNDIAAPGQDLVSTFPRQLTALRTNCAEQGYSLCASDDYRSGEGTSFAAPQVTAAAALLLSVRPLLQPDQVAYLLTRSSDDVNTSTGCRPCAELRDAYSGWGRLDVAKTLAALQGPIPARTGTSRTTTPVDRRRRCVSPEPTSLPPSTSGTTTWMSTSSTCASSSESS